MVPMLLAADILLIGFLFVASMLFQEKKEHSVSAYRVSPGGTINYIMSKALVNVILSVCFAIIFGIFTLGFNINYPAYFLIITIAALMMTLIGILMGQFFSSLSDFLYIMLAFMILMGLPIFTYMNPNFRFPGIELIPSYQIVFSVDSLMRTGWEWSKLTNTFLILGIELILIFMLTTYVTKKHLIKDKR